MPSNFGSPIRSEVVSPSAANGSVAGSGSATEVAYWSNSTTLTGNSNFTFDGNNLTIANGGLYLTSTASSYIVASVAAGNKFFVKGNSGDSTGLAFYQDGSLDISYVDAGPSDGQLILRTHGTNALTISNTQTVTAAVSVATPILKNTAAQTTLSGSAGTAVCSQPEQGSSYKKVVVYLSGYTDTGTQTFTYPTAFSHTPYVYGLTAGVAGASASTTAVTFTVTTQTGFVFLEGY